MNCPDLVVRGHNMWFILPSKVVIYSPVTAHTHTSIFYLSFSELIIPRSSVTARSEQLRYLPGIDLQQISWWLLSKDRSLCVCASTLASFNNTVCVHSVHGDPQVAPDWVSLCWLHDRRLVSLQLTCCCCCCLLTLWQTVHGHRIIG